MNKKILCIDLDGTLMKRDIQWLYLQYASWKQMINGILSFDRMLFKQNIYNTNAIEKMDIKQYLLYETIEFVNSQKEYQKILVTGAYDKMVNDILSYLDISFDEVIASSNISITGKRKRDFLIDRFHSFDYIGNEIRDCKIWNAANRKISVVYRNSFLHKMLKKKYQDMIFIFRT